VEWADKPVESMSTIPVRSIDDLAVALPRDIRSIQFAFCTFATPMYVG
jgi:hypothetical protein